MDIISIVSVIIAFCVLIVFIVVLVFQESDSKHKTPEEKMETLLTELFHDNTSLNNDALETYKALIQASFNASQTHKQDKPWR